MIETRPPSETHAADATLAAELGRLHGVPGPARVAELALGGAAAAAVVHSVHAVPARGREEGVELERQQAAGREAVLRYRAEAD